MIDSEGAVTDFQLEKAKIKWTFNTGFLCYKRRI